MNDAPTLDEYQEKYVKDIEELIKEKVTNPMIFLYKAEEFAKGVDNRPLYEKLKQDIKDAYGFASKYSEELYTYKKVIELIESFKSKFREPDNDDTFEWEQFVLPATDKLPCLVIQPHNMSCIHLQQFKQKGIQEIILKLKKEYPEVDINKLLKQ